METMGVTPTMPLYSSNDGMGMGGCWFWIILILLFSGRGFGYGAGEGAVLSDEFVKRDIFNTNANVSAQGCATQKEVIENRYTTQLGLQNLSQQMAACCCDLKAEGFKNTCDVLNAIHADGEATRALINANTIQDLRDRLAEAQRATDTANLALQNNAQTQTLLAQINKVPQPAYITCSPYVPAYGYSCGCTSM